MGRFFIVVIVYIEFCGIRKNKVKFYKPKPTETKAVSELEEKGAVNSAADTKVESNTNSEPVKANEKKPAARRSSVSKTAIAEKAASVEKKAASVEKKATRKSNTKATEEPAAEKKTVKRKTAAEPESKPAVKKALPKPVTIETICEKIEKKIDKTKVADIGKKIAVDIEVWGFEDGSSRNMFIEIKDGKASVQPYTYNEKNFRIAINFANAVAFANGKKTLKDLLEDSEGFYAEGNIVDAIKLAGVF